MKPAVESCELMKRLRKQNSGFFENARNLRNRIAEWLVHTVGTFPHYTLHTVAHSDEIIRQLSNILYSDSKSAKLNATELYILVCAAYLHDAGMVVSDSEKMAILARDDWKKWAAQPSVGERLATIETLRKVADGTSAVVRNFQADRQLRFLLAEYLRKHHHERAGNVIDSLDPELFSYGDDHLRRAVADVCIAHGLSRSALDDSRRFPTGRDVCGEHVNMRLLAVLFRLGDLLDLAHDRACPLLLSAACPLPPESYAHWNQYRRITHKLFTPEKIELRAECLTQEEHRVLQDWCQWIVDEVAAAPALLAEHGVATTWIPPRAKLGETIEIVPAREASYLFRNWRFELDVEKVFQRLIRDVYEDETDFVRELIQNALDAMRCRMYADLEAKGEPQPPYPTKVDAGIRSRYVLKLRLEEEKVANEMSGDSETRQVLVIEDCGIGMDEAVIEKHFLQIGRSFYISEDFRNHFTFHPTSRFGIGFLSVFAMSDHVVVETFKPSSREGRPLRFRLNGHRGYFLVESAPGRPAGTTIRARMKAGKELAPGKLEELVRHWCVAVEFPIEVEEPGRPPTVVVAQDSLAGVPQPVPYYGEGGGQLAIHAIPIDDDGVEGAVFIRKHKDANGSEDWTDSHKFNWQHRNHPGAQILIPPFGYVALHGILCCNLRECNEYDYYSYRIDIRNNNDMPVALSRQKSSPQFDVEAHLPQIAKNILINNIEEHISSIESSANPWVYLNKLANSIPMDSFWHNRRGMAPIICNGHVDYTSWSDVFAKDLITIALPLRAGNNTYEEGTICPGNDRRLWPINVLDHFRLASASYSGGSIIANFRRGKTRHREIATMAACDSQIVALSLGYSDLSLIINTSTELGAWLSRAITDREEDTPQIQALRRQISDYVLARTRGYFDSEILQRLRDLPPDQKLIEPPPALDGLTDEHFSWPVL